MSPTPYIYHPCKSMMDTKPLNIVRQQLQSSHAEQCGLRSRPAWCGHSCRTQLCWDSLTDNISWPHLSTHDTVITRLFDWFWLSKWIYQFSERYQMITTCPHCSSVKTFESTVLLNMNKWVSGVQVTEIVTILSGMKMVNPHLTVSNNFLVIILLHATILAAHNSPSQQRKEKCENIQNLDFFISCKSTQSMRATLF